MNCEKITKIAILHDNVGPRHNQVHNDRIEKIPKIGREFHPTRADGDLKMRAPHATDLDHPLCHCLFGVDKIFFPFFEKNICISIELS